MEKTKRGKGTKLMAVADSAGLPVAIHVASASPHEVTLVENTVTKCIIIDEKPTRLIADRAYDSDPLDYRMATQHGIELIAPHRSNRRLASTQDGRGLRRYMRRWKVEKECLHGCRISGVFRCAMIIMLTIILALYSLAAC